MPLNKPYRRGVGIVLLNADGKVFAGLRCDSADSKAWQMPQGGIEDGELPITAAYRELKEEVGTSDVKLIAEYPDLLKYDLPPKLANVSWGGKFLGQEQNWYLMQLNPSAQINIQTEHPEFQDYKWVNMEDLPATIVPFKKEMYSKLVKHFAANLKNL